MNLSREKRILESRLALVGIPYADNFENRRNIGERILYTVQNTAPESESLGNIRGVTYLFTITIYASSNEGVDALFGRTAKALKGYELSITDSGLDSNTGLYYCLFNASIYKQQF